MIPAAGALAMMCAACALGQPQAKAADPLYRSDPHVAEMFNLMRARRAEGAAADIAAFDAKLSDIGRAHAIEWEIDPASSETMIRRTARKAWAAALAHPDNLNALEAFNKSIGAW